MDRRKRKDTEAEHEARVKRVRWQSLLRQERTRYCIQFNTADSYDPATGKYWRSTWPILFHSRAQAELAMQTLPIFANADAVPGRGRIKSCTVERRMLPPLQERASCPAK